MDHIESAVKWAVALVATAATYLWGGWDVVLQALLVLVVIDYITGLAAAWVGKRLSSKAGARGIARKMGIFVIVALANVIDQTGGLGEPILRTMAAYFYTANEALSVLENLAEIGVPIPSRLAEALERLKGGEEDKHGDHQA